MSDTPHDKPRSETRCPQCGTVHPRIEQLERELAEATKYVATLEKVICGQGTESITRSAVTFTPPSARAVEWAERFMVQPGDPLIGGLAIAEAAREILRLAKVTPSATASVTQFDAVGWWDGEKALFEPNQVPVRGALLFRPRPTDRKVQDQ